MISSVCFPVFDFCKKTFKTLSYYFVWLPILVDVWLLLHHISDNLIAELHVHLNRGRSTQLCPTYIKSCKYIYARANWCYKYNDCHSVTLLSHAADESFYLGLTNFLFLLMMYQPALILLGTFWISMARWAWHIYLLNYAKSSAV